MCVARDAAGRRRRASSRPTGLQEDTLLTYPYWGMTRRPASLTLHVSEYYQCEGFNALSTPTPRLD